MGGWCVWFVRERETGGAWRLAEVGEEGELTMVEGDAEGSYVDFGQRGEDDVV